MLKVSIIAKDKINYEGEAEAVFVPTKTGIIEILPMHMQIVSVLVKGDVVVRASSKDKKFPILGGVLEVRTSDSVIILID